MGTPANGPRPSPYTATEGRTSGSIAIGIPMAAAISGSQARVSRRSSSVREALVTSVRCRPVRFQISQESMVPKRASPASPRRRRPGTSSSSQASFGPEK